MNKCSAYVGREVHEDTIQPKSSFARHLRAAKCRVTILPPERSSASGVANRIVLRVKSRGRIARGGGLRGSRVRLIAPAPKRT